MTNQISIDRLQELAGIVSLSTTPREFVRIVQWAADQSGTAGSAVPRAEPVASETCAKINVAPKAAAGPFAGDRPETAREQTAWTAGDEARMLDLVRARASRSDLIAAFPGRKMAAITHKASHVRKTHGIENALPPAARGPAVSPIIGAAWTDEDVAALAGALREGRATAEIASALFPDRTALAVQQRAQKLRRTDSTIPPAPPAVNGTPNFGPRPDAWTDADNAVLRVMWDAGETIPAIAKAMSRAEKAITVHRQRLGIPPRLPGWHKLRTDGGATSPVPAAAVPAPGEAPAAVPAPVDAPATKAALQTIARKPSDARIAAARAVVVERGAVLTSSQTRLLAHIDRMADSDDFAPADDLYLAESLARGIASSVIADQLGCEAKHLGPRLRALRNREIVNDKGQPTIEGQADLLAVLRFRARREEIEMGAPAAAQA